MRESHLINPKTQLSYILHLPHYKYFLSVPDMEHEAEKLIEEISKLNNLYGFCARHYIKDENAVRFLSEVDNAIRENKLSIDESTKIRINNFVTKSREYMANIKSMKVNDLKKI